MQIVQIVIDIPKEHYKLICTNKENAIVAHDICRRIANGKPLVYMLSEMKDKIINKERVEDSSNNQFYNFALNDVLDIINEYASGKEWE